MHGLENDKTFFANQDFPYHAEPQSLGNFRLNAEKQRRLQTGKYMYCGSNFATRFILSRETVGSRLVSSMGRADLLWPRVDLDLTRKVGPNTGRVNVDQWWARLEAGRGGDSFDPL